MAIQQDCLAYYLEEEILRYFKENRKPIEMKAIRNEALFNGVSTGFWGDSQWKAEEGKDWRSRTFIKKGKAKVIMAYSMVSDMILQGGKIPFALKPSPIYEIPLNDMVGQEREEVEERIRNGGRVIDQQLLECNADREIMKCILSGSMIGESYAKMYVHYVERRGWNQINYMPGSNKHERYTEFTERVLSPAFGYVDWWNIWRDLEEDDPNKGIGVVELEKMSPYDLRMKVGDPYWIEDAIEEVISECNTKNKTTTDDNEHNRFDLPNRNKTIDSYRFRCRVPKKVIEEYESKQFNDDVYIPEYDDERDGREVEVLAVVANGRTVRYTRIEGERYYYRSPWEMTLNKAQGIGVADNVEQTQRVLNGVIRNLEDNLRLSANVMFARLPDAFKNWDGVIKPGMDLELSAEVEDARQAFQQIIVQDVSGSLPGFSAMIERFLDEDSMLPRILQGAVAEKQKPDTLGEINILQQNAGKYLGGVIRNFDEGIIEPVISAFFRYNMNDPNITEGKGNFIVKAMGFSSFQDRAVKLQQLMQFYNMIVAAQELRGISGEYRLKSITDNIGKGLDIDPDEYTKTKEEKEIEQKQEAEAMAAAEQKQKQDMLEQIQLKLQFESALEEQKKQNTIEVDDNKAENEVAIGDEKLKNDLVKK